MCVSSFRDRSSGRHRAWTLCQPPPWKSARTSCPRSSPDHWSCMKPHPASNILKKPAITGLSDYRPNHIQHPNNQQGCGDDVVVVQGPPVMDSISISIIHLYLPTLYSLHLLYLFVHPGRGLPPLLLFLTLLHFYSSKRSFWVNIPLSESKEVVEVVLRTFI